MSPSQTESSCSSSYVEEYEIELLPTNELRQRILQYEEDIENTAEYIKSLSFYMDKKHKELLNFFNSQNYSSSDFSKSHSQIHALNSTRKHIQIAIHMSALTHV